ncbi:hypothetical protein FACS1894201_11200 [Bacteroidia bacterium]|nr:hypothetical protein FACS1894201_11200 [Bacteroidia bacterium]
MRELSEEVCAFANSAGGYLLIGVDDENVVCGVMLDNKQRSALQDSIRDISPAVYTEMYCVDIAGKAVWVIEVPAGSSKPHVLGGAIYIREGANTQKLTTADEMRSFFQQSDRIYFDEIACPDFDISTQLDENCFEEFRRASSISPAVPIEQVLSNLQVLDKSRIIKRGGVLFFAKQPENLFYQAVVRCVLFKGTDKVRILDDKIFTGTLYQQYRQAMNWIQHTLQVAYDIEGQGAGPRKEIWEIPLNVFKEAIINALSHRDYYEKGAKIMIEIYDDRVEISNPGGLLASVANQFGTKSL